MDPKDIRIKPRCLTFQPKSYHRPAAYTADGYMLPCCWLDDPKNDHALENEFHMKDEHLALKNVEAHKCQTYMMCKEPMNIDIWAKLSIIHHDTNMTPQTLPESQSNAYKRLL